jgi:thymidine kinase
MFEAHMFIGPMFSGKSTELMRQVSRYKAIGKRVLVINHTNDTRTDESIKTHDNVKHKAVKVHNLLLLVTKNMLKDVDIIAVDEAQFFPDLKEFILKNERSNLILYMAGLDGDSDRNPFGQILECIPLCDSVVKLRALDMINCDGHTKAPFSLRLTDATHSQIQIGAKEHYKAVSRENYLNAQSFKKLQETK